MSSQTCNISDKSSFAEGRLEGSYCSMLPIIRKTDLIHYPLRINDIPWNISWKHRVQRNRFDGWKRREICLSLILSPSLYIPYSFEVFASEQAPLRSEYPVLVHYQRSILRLIMLTSCSASDSSETNNGVPEKISAMTVTHSRFPSVPQPNDQISIAVPYRVAPISNSGALLIRHA